MNIMPLIVGATALAFPIAGLVHCSLKITVLRNAEKVAATAKETAWQLERSKLPECPIHARGGSLGFGGIKKVPPTPTPWVAAQEDAGLERLGNTLGLVVGGAPFSIWLFGLAIGGPLALLGASAFWGLSLFADSLSDRK